MKYYFPSIMVATALFILIFFIFFYAVNVEGYLIESWTAVSESGETGTLGSTFDRMFSQPSTIFLTTRIGRSELPYQDRLYLYIPQMYRSYLAVYVNGVKKGSCGFAEKRAGYFWNQPVIFELPDDFNEITLEVSGLYRIGTGSGVYIIPYLETKKYRLLSFMTRVMIPLAIGMALSIGVVLILLSTSLSSSDERKSYIYFGMAGLLAAIWLFDLIDYSNMGSVAFLLFFRKTAVSSAYLGFYFLVKGFSKMYNNKNGFFDRLILFLDVSAAVVFWLAPDLITMEKFISTVAIVLFVNAFYFVFQLPEIQSKVLVSSILFFMTCVVHDGLVIGFGIDNLKLLSNYGIVSMFIGFTYVLVIHYRDILTRLTITHTKSLTDPLTGAYNRGILAELQFSGDETFVYVDLDNFKKINDTHGHEIGDEILKTLVQTIRKNVRQSDVVVRMGGDEFLVILRGCKPEKAQEIFQKILIEFKNSHPLQSEFSYGVVLFKETLEKTLREADELMYRMKDVKKGTLK
ncbi:diguanylate cyclase [Thermotoga sp. Mc24]|uniref:GGDEF domain-containing protein n=1 Tax=Thermotoga sp. Mc24 TaxID=1231241 RepID=UPI000542C113|nr:GGDEF domain-containing protein [Thermotoga sp. Mc24]KHC91517.1 diguanylate cyclase [Thermotoga sp. Mc24]